MNEGTWSPTLDDESPYVSEGAKSGLGKEHSPKRSYRFSVEVVDSETGEVVLERWRVKSACFNPFATTDVEVTFLLLEAEPIRVLNDRLCNKLVDFIVEFYDQNGHVTDGLIYKDYKVDVGSTPDVCLHYNDCDDEEDYSMIELTIVAKHSPSIGKKE